MSMYQQGDVIIETLENEININGLSKIGKILAEGEVTGHSHKTVKSDSFLYNSGGTLILDAPTGTTIKHEEHKPINLPAGQYKIRKVMEYDHFAEEAREVID